MRCSLWSLEVVTGPTHGLEVARTLRVRLDLFANATGVDIHRTRCHVSGIAPDGLEQLVASKDAADVVGEIIEQPELRGSGGHEGAAHDEGHGAGIDFDVTDFDGRLRQERPFETTQYGLNPRHQFPRAKWFGDVIVRAQVQPKNAVGFAPFRRQENDRGGRERWDLPNLAAEFEAIFTRNP